MNDLTFARVKVNQSVEQLISPGDNHVRRQRFTSLANDLSQIRAFDKLHHKESSVALSEIISDARQHRVIELSQQVRLTLELFPERLIRGQRFLQRYSVVKMQIDSFVDCAHSAFAQLTNDAITAL